MLKKLLIILITLALITVAVVLLFLFFSKNKQSDSEGLDSTSQATDNQPTDLTPTPVIAENIDIFTTFDSKLQIQYPSDWIKQSLTPPSPDTLEIVGFSSGNPNGTQLVIEVSEQYNQQFENITQCKTDVSKICENKIISDKRSVVETSLNSSPKTITFYTIFSRKIYKLSFTIPAGQSQSSNIELVTNIISTLKLF